MYLFYVQGGGLGHLTRTDKLIQNLGYSLNEVLIITPSQFSLHFKKYNFLKLEWSDSKEQWKTTIDIALDKYPIKKCYIDTFPFGLKGELFSIYKKHNKISFCYVSRILKWNTYLENVPRPLPLSIDFDETILLEPLYDEHFQWIQKHSKKITTRSITYEELKEKPLLLFKTPYNLLVHSGGKEDLLYLCNFVLKDLKTRKQTSSKVVVLTQVDINFSHPLLHFFKGIFPATPYFKNAVIIYTAAGFNVIHELKEYRKKHIPIPIDRLYDDQFFRVKMILK